MNILIFGYGVVAKHRYEPNLRAVVGHLKPPARLDLECVDIGKPDCVEIATWNKDPRIRPEQVDRILILSPPTVHYQNLASIARTYASLGLDLPDIYIEKPLYLVSGRLLWSELVVKYPSLEGRVHYVDHYRFKPPLSWFIEHKSDIIASIGGIQELGIVSLEQQEFWDSAAFDRGYFLEHGCHLVGLLDRVFPGIAQREWTSRQTRDWRIWAQAGRPDCCKRDSASLTYLTLAGEVGSEVAPNVPLTVVMGKAMADIKVLYLKGKHGFCRLWFNTGRLEVGTDGTARADRTAHKIPAGDAHRLVAEYIVTGRSAPGLVLPLEQGMAEQEKIIVLGKELWRRCKPKETDHIETYAVGEMPAEIAGELQRMGL